MDTSGTETILMHDDSDSWSTVMKRMKLAVFACAAILALCAFFGSCSDDQPTEPNGGADTTSHSFIWYTDTLGEDLSRINDVFCLSEDDAWAVGYFYVRDEDTGQINHLKTANVAHWDGEEWTLMRVEPRVDGLGTFAEAWAVFGWIHDDIWVDNRHWNGKSWTAFNMNGIAHGRGRKIWGNRTDNIFIVGEKGSILRWDGSGFTEFGSQTTAANLDIWGCDDTMYVAVSDYDQQSGNWGYLIRLENGKVVGTEQAGSDVMITVWGMDGTWYSGGCQGVFRKTGDSWQRVLAPGPCVTGIRGTALNNVYILVQRGQVIHFNGSNFATILPQQPEGMYTGRISTSGKMVMATGYLGPYAVVKRGYQQ